MASSTHPHQTWSNRGTSRGGRRGFPRRMGAAAHSTGSERKLLDGLTDVPIQITVRTFPRSCSSDQVEPVSIDGMSFLASYNWIKDASTPTIIVPGSPPVLDLPLKNVPFTLEPDVGAYLDHNGIKMPKALLQPIIQAVDAHREYLDIPSFDWPSVDFVTDRNGLRKLLRWIISKSDSSRVCDPFRIDMQLAGRCTVLFNSWSPTYKSAMSGYTFGYHFEDAVTHPGVDCEETSSNQRIVTYEFGGLTVVMRFEVNAYMPSPTSGSSSTPFHVDNQASLPILSREEGLKVLLGGAECPQSSLVELATLAEWRADLIDWIDRLPQLYFSGTPHHILGRHTHGCFSRIERRHLDESPELCAGLESLEPAFRELRGLLETIKDIVVEHGEAGRLSLVYDGTNLTLRTRESKESCLPDVFMEKFE